MVSCPETFMSDQVLPFRGSTYLVDDREVLYQLFGALYSMADLSFPPDVIKKSSFCRFTVLTFRSPQLMSHVVVHSRVITVVNGIQH